VLDITRASKSPQVVLSRTHPGLLMKLFELEVPEIYEGIVRIEACAREPGHRAKIAVSSLDRDVDPVGACVGLKGSRVQAVVQELRGEAIDIIPYHPDPARFIVHAIAPAQVARVYMDEHTHSMELVVPDDQLSKAIGRRGQNVRLAAQLTGWRIDIFSETRHSEMTEQARVELSRIEELDQESVEILIRHGFRSAQELADAEAYEVGQILGIEESDGEKIVNRAEAVLDQLIMEEAERRKQKKEAPPADEADLAPDADEPNGHDDDLVPETGASEASKDAAHGDQDEEIDEGAPGRPPEA
jgi:N utilization substance protein A